MSSTKNVPCQKKFSYGEILEVELDEEGGMGYDDFGSLGRNDKCG